MRFVSSGAARGARAAWLVGASVVAALGLSWSLNSRERGQSWANLGSLARYVVVALVIVAVGYAVHRGVLRRARAGVWERAALDALVAVLIGGPAILFVVLLVATVHQCGSGAGC